MIDSATLRRLLAIVALAVAVASFVMGGELLAIAVVLVTVALLL